MGSEKILSIPLMHIGNKLDLPNVVEAQLNCKECSFCSSKNKIYIEMLCAESSDCSVTVRAGCSCRKSMQGYRDFNRTAFLSFEEVVDAWNKLQLEEVTEDSEVSF